MTNSITKRRIFVVEYGYKLFNEGGFSNVKINTIAKAGNMSNVSIYYIFKAKEALLNDILTIALGSFKSSLSYKTICSVSDLNSHLLTAFKEVPGLVYEINRYNKVVIDHLISIIAPLLSDSVRINLKADLCLICSTIVLSQNKNLKIRTNKMLQIIKNMNGHLNSVFYPTNNRVHLDDSNHKQLQICFFSWCNNFSHISLKGHPW